MTGRMSWDERYAELWELGRHIWEKLPAEQRDRHQIDRQRLTQRAQCACTCGAECPTWVFHLIEVRDYAELWTRLSVSVADPLEVGACCGHEYRRHLVGLDGCAVCEHHELKAARCAGWRRQLPESTT